MKLMIRADANNFIATGHVMRCISIAQVAIMEGHDVIFVVADLDAKVLLEKYNMQYKCLHTIWNEMDGEIGFIQHIINEEKPDCILVDSYYVTEKYLSALRSICKVAYIDDLNMFKYPCDILICYANYYKKFDYENYYDKNIELLLGPKYTPLRRAFYNVKRVANNNKKKNVLIMSGGTDKYHMVMNIIGEYVARQEKIEDINITAICGMYNEDYSEIISKYCGNNSIKILRVVDDIEKYMIDADVAISAGGTTLYELCACGTPTICYSLADNQLDNVKSFADSGIMAYVGDVRKESITTIIIDTVLGMLSDSESLRQIQRNMQMLVDGNGAHRIIESIEKIIGGEGL